MTTDELEVYCNALDTSIGSLIQKISFLEKELKSLRGIVFRGLKKK